MESETWSRSHVQDDRSQISVIHVDSRRTHAPAVAWSVYPKAMPCIPPMDWDLFVLKHDLILGSCVFPWSIQPFPLPRMTASCAASLQPWKVLGFCDCLQHASVRFLYPWRSTRTDNLMVTQIIMSSSCCSYNTPSLKARASLHHSSDFCHTMVCSDTRSFVHICASSAVLWNYTLRSYEFGCNCHCLVKFSV